MWRYHPGALFTACAVYVMLNSMSRMHSTTVVPLAWHPFVGIRRRLPPRDGLNSKSHEPTSAVTDHRFICSAVERFEFDAAPGQLPVEILVPVDAELARVGKVGAELDEEGSEVFVHAVKIIVVWLGICYPPSLENTSRFDGSI